MLEPQTNAFKGASRAVAGAGLLEQIPFTEQHILRQAKTEVSPSTEWMG